MAKHTQGAWTVHYPTSTDKRLMVLHPDGQRVIARLDEGFNSENGPISLEERQANARLIVQASETVTKAEEMLKKLQEDKKNHKDGDQCQGTNCTGCHFWSGSIAALSELLGEPGVID